jgi:hypothetical protein
MEQLGEDDNRAKLITLKIEEEDETFSISTGLEYLQLGNKLAATFRGVWPDSEANNQRYNPFLERLAERLYLPQREAKLLTGKKIDDVMWENLETVFNAMADGMTD